MPCRRWRLSNQIPSELSKAGDEIEKSIGVRYPEYRAGASELSVLLYHDDTMVDPTGVADYLTTLTDEMFLASEVA